MKDYLDNSSKFEEVYKKLCKPNGNKDNEQFTSPKYYWIAMAIEKYLRLVYSLSLFLEKKRFFASSYVSILN